MGTISTGNFGNFVPQTGRTPTAQDVSGGLGQAVDRLAATGSAIAGNELERIDREKRRADLQAAEQADRVQTINAHASIQNGLADTYDSITADLMAGKTDKIAATAAWKDASSKVVQDGVAGVNPKIAPLVTAEMNAFQGRLSNKLNDVFRKRDEQDTSAGLATYREQQQRFATTDPDLAIKQFNQAADQIGPSAGWAPERIQKEKQAFVEGVTLNRFRTKGQAAMQAGSVEAIDAVQQELTGPAGEAIDPGRRAALDQTLFGWRQSIEARQARQADAAERDATKRFNTAVTTINQNKDIALSGGFIAPEQIELMATQAQGIPELQGQVRELLESQKQVAGFASMPPAQRTQMLEGIRAGRADPKVGIDPLGQKQLNQAEQIDASLRKKVDDGAAWSAAQNVGIIRSLPALDLSNPQAAMSAFQQRSAEIGGVEAWAGKKISPLQPAEAEQFTKVLRSMKPDQAASMLGQIGAVVGDADRIGALSKQIGDKDGTMGMAMLYASAKTTEGRYTAELVLQGSQAIKDKVVKADGAVETGWRGSIAKAVRGAYSNAEVETKLIDAAFNIAAATNGDVDRAIRLATGGIVERNGGKIPLPYGMKEADFEKKLEGITAGSLADQAPGGVVVVGPNRVPVADFVRSIPDARLVHAGQGSYNVRAGNTLVTNERGQRITLKVGP